jgi:hypothetical protein
MAESATSFAAINAVRTALEQTQTELTVPRSQQAASEKASDVAVAMRLAADAIATAARAAETEVRKTRHLLEHAEERARQAEERAHLAEHRVAEWEKTFCKIRDDILGQLPTHHLAA